MKSPGRLIPGLRHRFTFGFSCPRPHPAWRCRSIRPPRATAPKATAASAPPWTPVNGRTSTPSTWSGVVGGVTTVPSTSSGDVLWVGAGFARLRIRNREHRARVHLEENTDFTPRPEEPVICRHPDSILEDPAGPVGRGFARPWPQHGSAQRHVLIDDVGAVGIEESDRRRLSCRVVDRVLEVRDVVEALGSNRRQLELLGDGWWNDRRHGGRGRGGSAFTLIVVIIVIITATILNG